VPYTYVLAKIGFLVFHSTKNHQYWLFWCPTIGIRIFLRKLAFRVEASEASLASTLNEVAVAAEVNWAEKVSNAQKITTEYFSLPDS
jgi:hypothetical protein